MASKKEKKAKVPRRPNRPLFALMLLITAVVIAFNVFVFKFVSPYFGFINTFMTEKPTAEEIAEETEASKDVTQKIESEGIILLVNEDDTLPLASETKVNVFGAGTVNFVYGGTGSGAGDTSSNATIYDGLEQAGITANPELKALLDENVETATDMGIVGTDWGIYEPEASIYTDDVIAQAKDYSDVAIVVISRQGGEGTDLPIDAASYTGFSEGQHFLELTQNEKDMLDVVEGNFGTVIVVLNSGNAMELGWLEDEGIDAALWVGNPGSTGCNAIGDVIAGAVNPSGRTVDTFAYEVESAPSYYNFGAYDYSNVTYTNTSLFGGGSGDAEHTEEGVYNYHYVDYVEGIYVGYRYYETAAADGYIDYDETVQFPFGYGLSYTEFDEKIDDFTDDGTTITMTVEVENTGDVAGKDVVEVYYTAPYNEGGIEKSEVVLGGFAKTKLLEPGESQEVEVSFTYEDMASYDYQGIKAEGGAYVLEAGEYEISLRSDAHTVIDSETVTVSEDVIYNDGNDGKRSTDEVAATNLFDDVSEGENLTYISRADWEGTMPTERAASSREASDEVIAGLNAENFVLDEDVEDITYAKNGLKLADMVGLDYDDPQWDSLLEQLSYDEMKLLVTNGGWETMGISSIGKPHTSDSDGPNGINNIMAGIQGVQLTGQSVLGYTWNVELAREMGEVFGAEATAYGISGLYAPAVNIHRSPFGGRNYEYVSEDGLLSGKIIASEIQGIQSTGTYVYLKHFAVNDQETHRCDGGLATWLNEQALREIYLKPFEICVKEGGTLGIMSSFNRLGTTPAAESSALLTNVLRGEWGFEGVVISDCVMACTTEDFARATIAGNDLQLTVLGQILVDEEVLDTPAGHQALRQASKNILYVIANSDAINRGDSGPYPLQIGLTVVGIVTALLLALYFWRRHKKLAAWKAAGRPAGWLATKLHGDKDAGEKSKAAPSDEA